MTPRRAAIGATIVGTLVVLALVLSLAIVTGGSSAGEESAALEDPVAVLTTISPREPRFGDLVEAEILVTVDEARVDPSRVQVAARFEPFRQLAAAEPAMSRTGGLTTLRYSYSIQCVEETCVSEEGSRTVLLPTAIVSYVEQGEPLGIDLHVMWPAVGVGSRLAAGSDEEPTIRSPASGLPEPSYTIDPTLLGWVLVGLAGVLVIGAGVVAARLLVRVDSPPSMAASEPQDDVVVSPLDRALEHVEVAAEAPEAADRRIALDELSRALDQQGLDGLAPRARRLAWSPTEPDAAEMVTLASSVREVRGRDA